MEDNTLLACLWDITLEWGGGCRKCTVKVYTYEGDVSLPSGCPLEIWTAIVLLFVQL